MNEIECKTVFLESVDYVSDCRAGEQPSRARNRTIIEDCYDPAVQCVISLGPKCSETLLKQTNKKQNFQKRGKRN